MDTKTPTITTPTNYHHQRAPRTPESYFNVPESIALLNIVKSERIQSAFQSNRKNHASVWEMVAEVLNRFSSRKRSAKQCCNRYENLKKIYTQLKKNPEKHVRRNWPYMFLFKEIEEQRGECWGSNGKRALALAAIKDHKDLSYYHRRRQVELSMLLHNNKDAAAAAAAAAAVHSNLLQSLVNSNSDHSNSNNSNKLERYLPNHFVEAQLNDVGSGCDGGGGIYDGSTNNLLLREQELRKNMERESCNTNSLINNNTLNNHELNVNSKDNGPEYEKDSNGALNLQTNDNQAPMKSEPLSEGEFNPDDIQLMQTNYNGTHNFYPEGIEPNILHPDVIVDTDNISDCSSASVKSKRKLSSTSTDVDSTNYELIEYLKRRERRDEEMLKRMDQREERLLNLLERTVLAIENLAATGQNKVI